MNISSKTGGDFEGLIYHVFPLGIGGASELNSESPAFQYNILSFGEWIPYLKNTGVNAVLFGPVLHSDSHGYDSVDLHNIDPRLGTNNDFRELVAELHKHGIAVVMDAVLNHVSRNFFAFQDIRDRREASHYRNWFAGLDFTKNNGHGDGFAYECWDGHEALVKLNLHNPDVREYLFSAVKLWIQDFGVDGLRLDAADVITPEFWPPLRRICDEAYKPVVQMPFNGWKFWLMGEMVFGDYSAVCSAQCLDSVTNYELYKGIYSSHNDSNYHELAHSLQREFGKNGVYRDIKLYTFVDNHDVNRISSLLHTPEHIYPVHILLFCVPGIPSLYYGSEAGIEGVKGTTSDWTLRPAIHPANIPHRGSHPDLHKTIQLLGDIRRSYPALQSGEYEELVVGHSQFGFMRKLADNSTELLILVNSSSEAVGISIPVSKLGFPIYRDVLNGDFTWNAENEDEQPVMVPPNWGRIFVGENL